jgi:hypothetical protein
MPDDIADAPDAEPTPVAVPPADEAPSATGVVAGDPDDLDDGAERPT